MAVQDPTTNFAWALPDVGGDSGAWGTLLNTIIGDDVTGIDKVVNDVKTTADAALPKAGGTMTGELKLLTERFTAVDSADSGTVTLDLDAANFFHITPTGAVTIAFSNVPASPDVVWIYIETFNAASQTLTWPSSVKWGSAQVPTPASNLDLYEGYTRDGGVTWHMERIRIDSQ